MNQQDNSQKQTLYLVAYIFAIIATVISGLFIIPLFWMVPMTIMINNAKKQVGTPNEKPHIALAICSLLFLGLISGICILIADVSTNNNTQTANTVVVEPVSKDEEATI
ncbi:hypothetical protein [Spiroplasma endosymbiont of Othius punctulatus]|uniref:hypothetical protein n=1 Tax=Spiroplasma endosymbiont of Othius punctulatus TaxID=3066289 RepID=UPI0030D3F4EC